MFIMTKRKADSKLVIGTEMSVCYKFKQLKHFIYKKEISVIALPYVKLSTCLLKHN